MKHKLTVIISISLLIVVSLLIYSKLGFNNSQSTTINKPITNTRTNNTLNNETKMVEDEIKDIDDANQTITDEMEVIVPAPNESIIYEIKKSPYKELLSRNSDYVGWVSINNTNISHPIVKGIDNDEYYRRNFDYETDQKGSIFMDYRNFGFDYSKNTVIYGHNLKTDEMFGDLKKYSDEDFALNNNIIEITDLYGTKQYEVVSSYFGDANNEFTILDFTTNSFEDYLDSILTLSQVNYNQELTPEDQLLTLVTCSYEIDDGRYYVHAKLIQD